MPYKKIGTGLSVSTRDDVEGTLIVIESVDDVIKLIQGEAEGKICYIEQAGATTLGPILSRITAIICETGSAGSHLAIVSREYEIPAFMSTQLEVDLKQLDGKKVKMHTPADSDRGEVYLCEE
ncbi:MAG: PEP-utilizing enzyme [Candidatus Helarchaeota archaeon]